MSQVIVFESLERSSSVKGLLDNLSRAGVTSPILIGEALPKNTLPKTNFISCSRGKLSKAFEKALEKSEDNKIILINSECGASEKQLKNLLREAEELQDATGYAAVRAEKALIEYNEKKLSALVPFLAANKPIPAMFLVISRDQAKAVIPLDGDSIVELSAQVLLLSLCGAISVQKLSEQVKPASEAYPALALHLTGIECARCIKAIVEAAPIEELFPQHPWGKYQEESLACCQHYLASLFIRLGEYKEARDALIQADQYEDSPRSLALKGISNARKGDWLTAAANFIASLQQYEVRLHENESHYIKFAPKDFQKINSALLAGLDALNHKKNQAAVEHFAQAVFMYDPFYLETGTTALKEVR